MSDQILCIRSLITIRPARAASGISIPVSVPDRYANGEGPANPHEQEDDEEGLSNEPYKSGDVVHHHVQSVESGNVQGHPASQEQCSGDTGSNEQVQVFGR